MNQIITLMPHSDACDNSLRSWAPTALTSILLILMPSWTLGPIWVWAQVIATAALMALMALWAYRISQSVNRTSLAVDESLGRIEDMHRS